MLGVFVVYFGVSIVVVILVICCFVDCDMIVVVLYLDDVCLKIFCLLFLDVFLLVDDILWCIECFESEFFLDQVEVIVWFF